MKRKDKEVARLRDLKDRLAAWEKIGMILAPGIVFYRVNKGTGPEADHYILDETNMEKMSRAIELSTQLLRHGHINY